MAVGSTGRWFLLPGLVFLFTIDLIPLLYSAWISFYNWWLLRPRDVRFVGLANYARLASDAEFTRAVVVTTLFTSGAVLVESVFAWPGMGRLSADAIFRRDYPVVTGAAILAATLVVAGSLVADLLYRVVDPRTRSAA